MTSIAHICHNEDTDDYLESPVNDILVWENDNHEENRKCEQYQELFLHVLQQLQEMSQSRISFFEIRLNIFFTFLYSLLILK